MVCDETGMIDLHTHSTASDGTIPPAGLVSMAVSLGLGALAITDHDTLDGVRSAIAAGIPSGLEFLTGVEISAASPPEYPCAGSFHILGYGIRLDDPDMDRELVRLQQARENRNPHIIERLNALGMDINIEEVIACSRDGQLGRPHIACVMVQKGYASSINDAFDRYIGTGKPAYVDKERVGCRRAIEIIRNAGGIAVLAHPGLLRRRPAVPFEDLIHTLKEMGLGGIEAWYPEHSAEQTARYQDAARRHELLATGGTDFHGTIKPGLAMGVAGGNFRVPCSVYESIITALSSQARR